MEAKKHWIILTWIASQFGMHLKFPLQSMRVLHAQTHEDQQSYKYLTLANISKIKMYILVKMARELRNIFPSCGEKSHAPWWRLVCHPDICTLPFYLYFPNNWNGGFWKNGHAANETELVHLPFWSPCFPDERINFNMWSGCVALCVYIIKEHEPCQFRKVWGLALMGRISDQLWTSRHFMEEVKERGWKK